MTDPVDRLKAQLAHTRTKIARKPNYTKTWHRLAAWLASLFLSWFGQDFERHFWTTLGDTIYTPKGHEPDLSRTIDYTTVCHELAHRYDDMEHGWYYRLTYILSPSMRATWEYRGYAMTEVARYRKTGQTLSKPALEALAERVSGATYAWAFDKEEFIDTMITVTSAIEQESVDVFDPNHKDFESLHPNLQLP